MTVLSGATVVWLMIGMVNVLLVTPSAKVSVPDLAVKSVPGMAVPAVVLYCTDTVPELPLVRVTVMVAVPAFSIHGI